MPAVFDIQAHDAYYQFVFYSAAGEALLISRWYPSQHLCEQAVANMVYRVLSGYQPAHIRDRSGTFSFSIRHTQQMLIAQSIDFGSQEESRTAFELVRNQVAGASVNRIDPMITVQNDLSEEVNLFRHAAAALSLWGFASSRHDNRR